MKVKLDEALFGDLILQANKSSRKRSHYILHKESTEPVQRFCIALKKGTYIRPQQHEKANKWELIVILKGTVGVVLFDSEGTIKEKVILNESGSLKGIEIKAKSFHTLFPITNEAIVLQVNEGPFVPTDENEFASWAPKEDDAKAIDYLNWLVKAKPGDKYS